MKNIQWMHKDRTQEKLKTKIIKQQKEEMNKEVQKQLENEE